MEQTQKVTQAIARFIAETKYEQIPPEAVAVAKRAILDGVIVSIGGRAKPEADIVVEYVRELGGVAESAVIGAGFRAPAPHAAFANGVMAAALDYGDTSLTWGVGHPSQAMLPVILALGDKGPRSGRDAIEAYVVGFEVGSRIGAGWTRHYDLGWHTTATIGTLAAAAAAAKVLGLDAHRAQMALGIAGSTVSGLKRQFGTMATAFNSGKAARDGVVAASLAQKGYTADASMLEGDNGLAQLMTGGAFDLPKMTAGLGKVFDLTAPGGLYLKWYPCCHLAQWCLRAVAQLVRENSVNARDVAEVTCYLPPSFISTLCSAPKTGLDALRSLEYCIANLLLDGRISPEQFTDTALARPHAQAIMRRVRLIPLEDAVTVADAMNQPQLVVLRLTDGREHRRQVDLSRADLLRAPMTEEELAAKVRMCTGAPVGRGFGLRPESQMAEIIALCRRLETVSRLSVLTDLLL